MTTGDARATDGTDQDSVGSTHASNTNPPALPDLPQHHFTDMSALSPHDDGKMPLVSVIVPLFNSEAYVSRCLESVLIQDYGNLELICINDGSTDGTGTFLSRLASADRRVRVLTQENRGAGASRNLGLSVACGEYIMFLDSDDLLLPRCIDTCVRHMVAEELDMLLFSAVIERADNFAANHSLNYYKMDRACQPDPTSGVQLYVWLRKCHEYRASPCTRMVSAELLTGSRATFAEGVIHEDESFAFSLMLSAHRCLCIPDGLYMRLLRPGSVMTGSGCLKHVVGLTEAVRLMVATGRNLTPHTPERSTAVGHTFRILGAATLQFLARPWTFAAISPLLRAAGAWALFAVSSAVARPRPPAPPASTNPRLAPQPGLTG